MAAASNLQLSRTAGQSGVQSQVAPVLALTRTNERNPLAAGTLPREIMRDADSDSSSDGLDVRQESDEECSESIQECAAFKELSSVKQQQILYTEWESKIGIEHSLPEWRDEIKEGMTNKLFHILCLEQIQSVFGGLSVLIFTRLQIIHDLVDLGRQKAT